MKEWSNLKKGLFFGGVIIVLVFVLILDGAKSKTAQEEAAAEKPVYWIANYELAEKMMAENEGYIIIDARSADEFAKGHLKDAICMAPESIGETPMPEYPDPEQMFFVYAKNSKDCKTVCENMAKAGYKQVYYIGVASKWKDKFVV